MSVSVPAIVRSLSESTPRVIGPEILSFLRSKGFDDPQYVRVAPSSLARPGWCHENVRRAVADRGGRPVYGVAVSCNALFATFEYHAVRRREDGTLVDETPQDGDPMSLFAIDPSVGPDFDFLKRPAALRLRLYCGLPAETRAAQFVACMSDFEMRSAARRAGKAGLPLEVYVASRLQPDRLERTVDHLLDVCGQAEALLKPTADGQWCDDVPRWRALEELKTALFVSVARQWEAHPARILAVDATEAVDLAGGPRP
jgi:hypothetical protein